MSEIDFLRDVAKFVEAEVELLRDPTNGANQTAYGDAMAQLGFDDASDQKRAELARQGDIRRRRRNNPRRKHPTVLIVDAGPADPPPRTSLTPEPKPKPAPPKPEPMVVADAAPPVVVRSRKKQKRAPVIPKDRPAPKPEKQKPKRKKRAIDLIVDSLEGRDDLDRHNITDRAGDRL